jgi:hypothetical protein
VSIAAVAVLAIAGAGEHSAAPLAADTSASTPALQARPLAAQASAPAATW